MISNPVQKVSVNVQMPDIIAIILLTRYTFDQLIELEAYQERISLIQLLYDLLTLNSCGEVTPEYAETLLRAPSLFHPPTEVSSGIVRWDSTCDNQDCETCGYGKTVKFQYLALPDERNNFSILSDSYPTSSESEPESFSVWSEILGLINFIELAHQYTENWTFNGSSQFYYTAGQVRDIYTLFSFIEPQICLLGDTSLQVRMIRLMEVFRYADEHRQKVYIGYKA